MNLDFNVAIQLGHPIDKNFKKDTALKNILYALQAEGYYGVELNVVDFNAIDPYELVEFLEKFNLKLTMIATGVYAKRNGLSLSDLCEISRKKTINALLKILNFADNAGCGVICGFIKGPAGQNYQEASSRFLASLSEISKSGNGKTALYIEVTNHYETTVAKCIKETEHLLKNQPQWIKILLDTYHMNIEESHMEAGLIAPAREGMNIHFSDNNRRFPGYGSLDFYKLLFLLKQRGYGGVITIEGNTSEDLMEDIKETSSYMRSVFRKLKNTA